jgi:hypothetical protein
LALRDLLLASCNFLSLGRLHHCESSRPLRFAKYSLCSCFCIFSSFCFSCLLSNNGIATKACYLSTPRARSGSSPWKLGPSIVLVKIRDHIVIRIVICIEPDRFLETWPPIPAYSQRRAKFRRVCLSLYLQVHLTPFFPDPKSFI